MSLDPYEILNVSKNDSLEHIEYIYRETIKLISRDTVVGGYKLTREEKNEMLQNYREAYRIIREIHKSNDKLPDYKMTYKIEGANVIAKETENFNKDKFNKLFEQNQLRDIKNGMGDPFKRGYGEFDKDFNNTTTVTKSSYNPNMSTEESKNVIKPEMKGNRLMEYTPTVFDTGSTIYGELGIAEVSDFSTTISGKNSLGGTDLMSVYSKNFENWEATFKRDRNKYQLYEDNKVSDETINNLKMKRVDIYNEPLDVKMIAKEHTEKMKYELSESLRLKNLKKRDEYYNNLNMGRLTDKNM